MSSRTRSQLQLAATKRRNKLTGEERAYRSGKFPSCIGRFPECTEYTEDMPPEERPECRLCPFHKK